MAPCFIFQRHLRLLPGNAALDTAKRQLIFHNLKLAIDNSHYAISTSV